MTTTPQLSIVTVDSTGKADEMPLEALLELLKPMLPAPIEGEELEAVPYNLEKVARLPPAPEQTVDLDKGALFYCLVKKGQPSTFRLKSTVPEMDSASARIRLIAEDAVSLPDVAFWAGGKPDIKGHGWLTVSRIRIIDGGKARLVWEASWLPLVAV